MIPTLLTIRVQWLRLWVPLIIIWLLLLPVILVLLPFMVLCLLIDVSAWYALKAFWRLLCAMPGTSIEFTTGTHIFALKIS